MFHRLLPLLLVATAILISGCKDSASNESIIKNVVLGGMSSKAELLKDSKDIFADYQVYRDGKADGVVFKYVYAEGVEVDRSMLEPAVIKKGMLDEHKNDSETEAILRAGIYMKFVYVSSSGEVYSETKITSEDL